MVLTVYLQMLLEVQNEIIYLKILQQDRILRMELEFIEMKDVD
jgi:hypothetical protein